jgi:hypothetical protein
MTSLRTGWCCEIKVQLDSQNAKALFRSVSLPNSREGAEYCTQKWQIHATKPELWTRVTAHSLVTEMVRRLNFTDVLEDLVGRFKEDHRHATRSVGIDLAKATFHLVALGGHGKVLLN